MELVEAVVALKQALPWIGRTDTKIVIALLGSSRPVSYEKLAAMIGQKPASCSCVNALTEAGFLIRTGDSFALAAPSQWDGRKVAAIRVREEQSKLGRQAKNDLARMRNRTRVAPSDTPALEVTS